MRRGLGVQAFRRSGVQGDGDVPTAAGPNARTPERPNARTPLPWLKPAVFTGSLLPLAALVIRGARGQLSADPIAYVLKQFGLLTLIFLIATLALTPLRKVTGWTWPIRIRRMLGLFAFFYACLHFLTYSVVDQGLDLGAIWQDITKRNFILVGFLAWLLLIPLAWTSTNGAVRRLGAAKWQRLHRLVYLIAGLAILHFVWRVKKDYTEPIVYGVVVAALLLFRVWDAWRVRRVKRERIKG
jgi:methionine sulfoxide reductase heme-binding subunit